MPMPESHVIGIPSPADGTLDLERIVTQFEGAWLRGECPDIREYVSVDADQARQRELLSELIMLDLEFRWRTWAETAPLPETPGGLRSAPLVLADYLERFADLLDAQQPPLELICEEYRVRQRWGDQPTIAEYLSRFGTHGLSLRERLLEVDAELQRDEAGIRPAPAELDGEFQETNRFPLGRRMPPSGMGVDSRYQLCEKLGEGGMAVVYRARDRQTGQEVALKAMKMRLGATAEPRFRREFCAVSAVRHPHCIQVFDLGATPSGPYFTMELFRGAPITSLYGQPLPVVLQALDQAASAIDYVHSQGIVHRDVKPSNLMVRVTTEDGAEPRVEVKLTDFGLTRFVASAVALTETGGFVGTPLYSAPEQIANEMLDHRVDLYALGLVCYEVLAGRHPFEECGRAGVQRLMEAHVHQMPPPLHHHAPEVPAEIEQAVMALLAKQPLDRPQSARLLRQTLARQIGNRAPRDMEPTAGSRAVAQLGQPVFVAREEELSVARRLLHQALSAHGTSREEWARHPIPSVVFIRGDAGIGKTRLLQEVVRLARGLGASVHEGRCFEGNLSPYQPFVDILSSILSVIRSRSRQAAADSDGGPPAGPGPPAASNTQTDEAEADLSAAQALIAQYTPELLRIAPDLRTQLAGEAFKQVDLSRETNYVLRAVANFLVDMAATHATCLCLEDLQWADRGSLDLLRHASSALYWRREHRAADELSGTPLIIFCTMRCGAEQVQHLIHELRSQSQAVVLEVQSFTREAISQLVTLLVGPAEEKLVEVLYRRCHGNAFFICECLRAWLADGRLVRSGGRWITASPLDDATALPDTVRELLRTRLQALSPAARQVLAAAAVIGAVVPIDLLRQTSGEMAENAFLDAVDELIAARMVVENEQGLQLELAHDLLREVACAELSASRRSALHRRVAELLEPRQTTDVRCPPEVLAFHFSAGGMNQKAFLYLLDAAEAALRAYAADDAIQHLRRARELAPDLREEEQVFRLYGLLAAAHTARGRPAEAIRYHQRTLESTTDVVVRAKVLHEIGQLQFRVGDFDQAIECFDSALAAVGMERPRSIVGTVGSIVICFVRGLWPPWLPPRRPWTREGRSRVMIARQVLYQTINLWAQRSILHGTQAHMRQLLLAEALGDPVQLADAFAEHSLFLGIFSLNRLGLRAGRKALAYAVRSGDALAESIARGILGTVHYYGAEFELAQQFLREALAVLDRRGDSWFRQFFYHNLRHLYSITGDTEREIECAGLELQIGEGVQDPEGICWGAYGMANALARSGRLEEAREYIGRALDIISRRTNIISGPVALHTAGFVDLQGGDYAAAHHRLEEGRNILERSFAYVDYSMRTYPLLVESILGPQWHLMDQHRDGQSLRQAWSISRRGLFWSWRFPNYWPHALRARGRAAWTQGRRQAALGYFSRSIQAADAIGAQYDLARACLDLAKVCDERREELTRRGQDILSRLGAVVPLSER